jgi:hypothetical protein
VTIDITSIAIYAHQITKELRKTGRRKEGRKTARNTSRRKKERKEGHKQRGRDTFTSKTSTEGG